MQYNFCQRIFRRVLAGEIIEIESIPCENCTMEVGEISGSAPNLSSCHVEVLFGEDIIFATHGNLIDKTGMKLLGSEGKSLKFRLVNNSDKEETMGIIFAGNKSE
jgi:hypothetical protein